MNVQSPQPLPVHCDRLDQLLQLVPVLESIVAHEEPLVDIIFLLVGEGRQVRGQVEPSSHVDRLELVVGRRGQSDFSDPLLDVFEEEGHCLPLGIAFVQFDHLLRGLVRSSKLKDDLASELVPSEVLESARDYRHILPMLQSGPERHQCDPCLEREQVGVVMRAPLREDAYCPVSAQVVPDVLIDMALVHLR